MLAPDDAFVTNPLALHEAGCPTNQIMAELRAQLTRLRDLGFSIQYIDTHMCFDWIHPPDQDDQRLIHVLQDWAAEEGLFFGPSHAALQGALSAETPELLAAEIAAMPADGARLVVQHPCYSDEETAAATLPNGELAGVAEDRDRQRRMFTDPAVVTAVQEHGVKLTRFDEL